VAIRRNPGTHATRVAEFISFDRTTIGLVLGRLEAKGLIVRKPGVTDKRTKCLYLTAEGEATIEGATAAVSRINERILGALSVDQRRQLLELLALLSGEEEGQLSQDSVQSGSNIRSPEARTIPVPPASPGRRACR
uniref:MarR family winged helix-turn-helix transcriptional regulator n=1 Tax=Halomonas sp. 25-S5 TaxID=2994065 RepID=UPI002468C869